MLEKLDIFERYIFRKNDEMYELAMLLASAMHCTDIQKLGEERLENNVDMACTILEEVEFVLKERGIGACYPFYDDDGVPCYQTDECIHPDCIFKKEL